MAGDARAARALGTARPRPRRGDDRPPRHAGGWSALTRSGIAVLATAALLLLAAPAGAADPLPLRSASPADRATVAPTPTGGIPWQVGIVGLPPEAQVAVTVTSSAATGADGATLDDANRIDFFFLSQNAANPTLYAARSDPGPNAWSADAGTSFWQVTATYTDGSGVFHTAVSDIQRIVIGTPPPPGTAPTTPGSTTTRATLAMSSLDATYYVRQLIRRRTKRTPVGLHVGCRRLASASFRCRPAWRDSRNVYTATTATLRHVRSGSRVVSSATLRGRRANRQCVAQRSLRSCGVAFRWQSRIAARPRGTRAARPIV